MSILNYLKVIPKSTSKLMHQNHPDLLDPTGPLSIKVPSSTIFTVNAKVVLAIERPTTKVTEARIHT